MDKGKKLLSANEFTAGTFTEAKPLSLVLPRSKSETTALIGRIHDEPAAVLLDGPHAFTFFDTSSASNWRGIIISNVRIELDEESAFDPDKVDFSPGAIVRSKKEISLCAKAPNSFGSFSFLTMDSNLSIESSLEVGFLNWQIVLGEGREKRILFNQHSGSVNSN